MADVALTTCSSVAACDCLLSFVCCLPSFVCHQLSTTYGMLFIFCGGLRFDQQ
jgi:hypothetical protein